MARYCCVTSCQNANTWNTGHHISYMLVSSSNQDWFNQVLTLAGHENPQDVMGPVYICTEHFATKDLQAWGPGKKIISGRLPSRRLPNIEDNFIQEEQVHIVWNEEDRDYYVQITGLDLDYISATAEDFFQNHNNPIINPEISPKPTKVTADNWMQLFNETDYEDDPPVVQPSHTPESGRIQYKKIKRTSYKKIRTDILKHLAIRRENLPEKQKRIKQDIDYVRFPGQVDIEEIFPACFCIAPLYMGPRYTHMGTSANHHILRGQYQNRLGLTCDQLRLVKITYEEPDIHRLQMCPQAKSIIRRETEQEKVLIIFKEMKGHSCANSLIVVAVIFWDWMDKEQADDYYYYATRVLPLYKPSCTRACRTNPYKACQCNGDKIFGGLCVTSGCILHFNKQMCIWCKSAEARPFELTNPAKEAEYAEKVNTFATHAANTMEKALPKVFDNMTRHEADGLSCRIGYGEKRPYSAFTLVSDFCCHDHLDKCNMSGGCTAVMTLLRPKTEFAMATRTKKYNEQLHVLSYYSLDETFYTGGTETQRETQYGGVGIALSHGSILYECARLETHSTTALPQPDHLNATRAAFVVFQHHSLNLPNHAVDFKV